MIKDVNIEIIDTNKLAYQHHRKDNSHPSLFKNESS